MKRKNRSWAKRNLFVYLFFLSISFVSVAQNNKPILRMGNAHVQSFDDDWLFSRYGLQADGTRKDEPAGLETISGNDQGWQKLNLPHDWAITGPFRIDLAGETGKLPWKGIGWYRKHFFIPASDRGRKIFVDFDGAMAYAKIWLNGKYAGTWPYGYSSFRMDLTPFIIAGQENTIAVRLDTENWDSRWYPGAGIYRHVWLVKTNNVHVAHWGTYITTPEIKNNSARVDLKITVNNESRQTVKAVVQTGIFELDQNDRPVKKVAAATASTLTINAGETKVSLSQANLLNPKRWDIETPDRYLAQTSIVVNGKVVDEYNTVFGVRTLAFTARNGFLLNGKRIPINGTCNHHDLGALGAGINTSALARQLTMLKEMGCNALRTSHNPPAPELLELADKMGFLVWDEAFDTWRKGKKKNDYNKLFNEWYEKDLTALVRRDRNHPSVIIWSIGNEVPDQRDVQLNRELADIVHREDPARPVSNGYNDPNGSREAGSPMAMDIMGVNYFFSQQAKWDADPRYADKPTIGSETSSCISSRGEYFFGTDKKNWQMSSYDKAKPRWGCTPDEQFRVNAKYPHLLGEFVWTGFDYLGEPTPYGSDDANLVELRSDPSRKEELKRKLEEMELKGPPSRSSYFGIIDLCGFPKDRFYNYQAHWRPEFPMAHIFPHWNWKERIDSIVPVHVYTSGDEAELFLNGKGLGRKTKKTGEDFRLEWDSVIYSPGELRVIAYKEGKPWATDAVKTTGEATKLSLIPDRKEIKGDGADLAFLTLRVQDTEGLMVPRSHPAITFTVEGPGEIVATDNGDASSFVPFQSHTRPAYNGMALAIVKAVKGQKGMIRVKATSEGLVAATAEIVIK